MSRSSHLPANPPAATPRNLARSVQSRAFAGLNAVLAPAIRAGLGSPWPIGAGAVIVESTGRRSGLPRQVPLLALRAGDRVYTSTVRPTSQWTRNLRAEPSARVWLHGTPRPATASIRTGPLTIAELRLDQTC